MVPDQLRTELEQRIAHAVTPREAAVGVMKELQRHYGWLTDEAVDEAAELLGLAPIQVEELATFYEMLYRRPVGKRVVHVCDSISCWSMGGDSLMQQLASHLGVTPGETTGDGMFTLLPCCCLGNCGNSPTMMVGDNLHGDLNLEKAVKILEDEKRMIMEKKEA
jgi:NADH-quinone oxidoreductase subunit E